MSGHPTVSLTVTDAEAAAACVRFCNDHRLLVEAACGTALAPLYNGSIKYALPQLDDNSLIVAIVCGGAAVSCDTLRDYSVTYDIPLLE
jgi:L-serine/L-threonine ammonia-lyase